MRFSYLVRRFGVLATLFCSGLAGCSGGSAVSPRIPLPANAGNAQEQLSATARSNLLAPAASNYRLVWSFLGAAAGPHGATPMGSLTNVNGTLYGTTDSGGKNGVGTVYSMTTAGKETLLYDFGLAPDGYAPVGGLTDIDGTLYGTAQVGGTGAGAAAGGTVFKVTTAGKETVLHSFGSGSDGWAPEAGLTDLNGTLYGTTISTGAGTGAGTVFRITPSGTESVVHHFSGTPDGQGPGASLTVLDGTLYGTTTFGGRANDGTVFSISPSGAERVLHSFGSGTDGRYPGAGLVSLNGKLYGTTYGGGSAHNTNGGGTVFSITTSGTESVLHSFGNGTDGIGPAANLIAVDGVLYGTTFAGGAYCTGNITFCNGSGTVFRITSSGAESVLHSFGNAKDGSEPEAALVDVNGTLYGTTTAGGTYGYGTVFAVWP